MVKAIGNELWLFWNISICYAALFTKENTADEMMISGDVSPDHI